MSSVQDPDAILFWNPDPDPRHWFLGSGSAACLEWMAARQDWCLGIFGSKCGKYTVKNHGTDPETNYDGNPDPSIGHERDPDPGTNHARTPDPGTNDDRNLAEAGKIIESGLIVYPDPQIRIITSTFDFCFPLVQYIIHLFSFNFVFPRFVVIMLEAVILQKYLTILSVCSFGKNKLIKPWYNW